MSWIQTDGQEVDEAADYDYIWICWDEGGIELVAGWASLNWSHISHWQPADVIVPRRP